MSAEARVRGLPFWKGPIELVPLKGGVSNASFTVQDSTGKYVARVGADYPFHHVFREAEVTASRAAFEEGLSPEVVHTEPGIMVVRFLEAQTFTEADVRAHPDECLDMVIRCHLGMGKRISGRANFFWVFHVLRDYARTLRAANHRQVPIFHTGWRRLSVWKKRRCRFLLYLAIMTCCPQTSWMTARGCG